MNKRFFNQQNLTRRLRLLPVLFAMLLMPLGAWAEDYPIKIGDTTLSSENIGNYAGVSYDADTRTMTLNGAALHAPIVWSGDDDFVIEINTTSVSSISIDDYTPVIQGDGTSSLTIKRAEYSSQTACLELSAYYHATEANFDKESCSPIIQGFTSVSTPGLQKVFKSRGIDEGKEFTLYLNEKPSVAVAGNEPDDGIFTVGVTPEGSVTFDATTNILYMNNATISISGDNNGICNSLETLTIKLKGNNKIISEMSDAIVSDNEIGSLVIERDNIDVGPAQLIISAADEVIEGFSSLTYNEFTPYSVENNAPVSSINITYDQVSGISDGTNELHSIAFVAPGTSIVVAGHAPGTDGTITGAGISGTVTFTPASGDNPATLTLNKATIDMSEIPGLCPIESSIANLTIQLIGYNKLTPNSDNFNGIKFTEGTTTGNLTFTTSNVVEEYGSLSVDGIYQFSDLTSGYNVTNSFTTGEQTGWSKTESGGYGQTYNSVRIDYTEYYDVWVGGARLSSSSLSPVSGGTKYIPSTHTLHLAGYGYDNEIKSGLPEFIVEVSGSNNSVSNITFEGNTPGTIIFKKDESSVSGNKVDFTGSVKGFSSVTITPPLQLVSPSGYNNPTSAQWNSFTNVSIADYVTYNIIVAGVQVTDANKGNVLNDAGTPTVVFTPADNTVSPATPATLTLNGASITGTIFVYEGPLNVSLSGNNILNGDNETDYAFVTEVGGALNFITDASNPGQLLMKGYTKAYVQNNLTASYLNGLGYTWEGSAFAIATLPTMTPESGVYWTDTKFTISGNEGATLGYTGDGETFTAYTAPFTLALGSQTLFPYSEVTDGTNTVHVRPADGQIYYIYNKLGFSVAAGTYNETQNITLTNLPESLPEGADAYPQVWYFLGDDDNDDSNDIRITSATQTIEVNESTKVSVYILDGDSSKKKKSEVVEAEYVIRQDPNLQFVQGETAVTAAEYTIGGTDNPALPTLKNTNEVAVTYESSDPAVATVDTDGTVTPVGVGTTTITASCVQSETLLADEASYTLTVNRQLNVSFSTSNEWATYYGSENLAMPEGLKAYKVTAVDGSTVTIGEIGYIPANTAVLLKNVSNNNTWSNIAASAYTGATSTFASNKLIGTASDVDVSTISGGTVYVLYNNMFKRATGGTIPANRGYLVVEPSVVNVGSGAPELSISIGDENTTAISNTDFTDNTDKAGEWFSIDGVKLNGQPQKPGLYIKNGKRVFINKK